MTGQVGQARMPGMRVSGSFRWLAAVPALLALTTGVAAAITQAGSDPEIATKVIHTGVVHARLGLGPVVLNSSVDSEVSAAELRAVLSADLEFSDYFELVDLGASGRDERVDQPPAPPAGVQALDGRVAAGAHVAAAQAESTLEAYLFEGQRDNLIAGKRYRGEPDTLRQMIHLFSDEVVRQLFGDNGVAHTQIAFVANATGNKELYIMDYDGAGVEQLTAHGKLLLSPDFSPDGKQIAFVSYARIRPEIYIYDLETRRSRLVIGGQELHSAPVFSPDGKQLAFARSVKEDEAEIFITDLGELSMRRLTHKRGIDTSPVFSPSGGQIAFNSARSGSPQVWVMDSDGSNERRVTFQGGYNTSPAWQPKALPGQTTRIAFAGEFGGVFQICTVNSDGTGFQQLTGGPGNKEDPVFSPDGRHIAYSTSEGGAYQIALMHADGRGKRIVTQGRFNHTAPTWSP